MLKYFTQEEIEFLCKTFGLEPEDLDVAEEVPAKEFLEELEDLKGETK